MNTHWWQVLPAIPAAEDTLAYRRLKRVWKDRTRFPPMKDTENRSQRHEFVNSSHETHLTVTLWENFVLFDSKIWLPKLFGLAGLEWNFGDVDEVRWSYEWESRNPKKCIADLVIHCKTIEVQEVIIVIEAKKRDGKFGEKDKLLSTYLDAESLRSRTNHRFLLHLIDENNRAKISAEQREDGCRSAIITWQQLGGLQVELARELDLPPTVSAFIAGSIQHQFCAHDILPDKLAFEYLSSEPSMQQVDDDPQYRLPAKGYEEPLWRIE